MGPFFRGFSRLAVSTLAVLASWALAAPQWPDAADSLAPAATQRLVLGVYAHVRSTEILQKLGPPHRSLEQALDAEGVGQGRDQDPSDLGARVGALADGSVDFSRLGPISYALVKQKNPGIRLLAIESNQGSKRFNGVISVPERSPIRSVEDLRGKSVAFGDPYSTAGRFLAQAGVLEAGVGASDLQGYAHLGRHDRVAYAVAAGNYDAGALRGGVIDGIAVPQKARVIGCFEVPHKVWVVREGIDEALFLALQQTSLALGGDESLVPLQIKDFAPTDDGAYDGVRKSLQRARGVEQHP